MLIECILKRPNGTEVDLGGVNYHFLPDAAGRHVCEVENEEHVARFLSISEAYRWAKPLGGEKPAEKPVEPVKAETKPAETPVVTAPAAESAGSAGGAAEPSGESTASSEGAGGDEFDAMTREELDAAHKKRFGKAPNKRLSDDKVRDVLRVQEE